MTYLQKIFAYFVESIVYLWCRKTCFQCRFLCVFERHRRQSVSEPRKTHIFVNVTVVVVVMRFVCSITSLSRPGYSHRSTCLTQCHSTGIKGMSHHTQQKTPTFNPEIESGTQTFRLGHTFILRPA